MKTPMIPQCNPRAAYYAQADGIDIAIKRVLDSERYILGSEVTNFETEFSNYIGTSYALGVANGTDAIMIALKALEIGAGDIVLTVSHTAVATVVAIRSTGASPMFVDVDNNTGLIDLDGLERLLVHISSGLNSVSLKHVKAVIPVHLYGRCVDMPRLLEISSRYGLEVIEDCAQAHGVSFDGRRAGSFGTFGCFSFYPTKNLGAIGDGGAVVSHSADLLEKARLQREYGWRQRYISDVEGGNSRLDELQAALLRVKLGRLDLDNNARITIANYYREHIKQPLITLPDKTDVGQHVYHQFAIRTKSRDALQSYLKDMGIGTLVHYPRAIHQQPAYTSHAFIPFPLPNTENWSSEVLSLPMFPQLELFNVEYIVAKINAWHGS